MVDTTPDTTPLTGQGHGGGPAPQAMAGMQRLMDHFAGYFAVSVLGLGHRSGLLAALLEGGGTAEQIAARAGAHDRSAEEWLAALTAAGYVRHDQGSFSLVEGQDAVFRPGLLPFDVTVFLEFQEKFGGMIGQVATAMREGTGVPYSAYQPEFGRLQDRLNGPLYEQFLISDFVASAQGLVGRLEAGVDVADVGCGGGQALCLLAASFPASRFVGYDIDEGALSIAAARAAERGLGNVGLENRDAARLELDGVLDVVIAVDAIHDQGAPDEVLAAIARALRPGGVLLMVEPLASGELDVDAARPTALMGFATSLSHCVQVSLAAGGPGLGAMWGKSRALPMLRAAGFRTVTTHESPADYLVYAAYV
ncbi:MAG: hypothetical protein AVDCRST_MAG26-4730 [uncultured Chloroflexia bacterium]|uniref:Polyketide synthase-like methyltransferase domain-containing protein n=1 Tax=uncultured Chloroflexia bacterium TaxID=1672391 RepID=A0A6J4KAF8_9CHLR|nr:MAG: hypothetical protein AVDCRST_MAG26-4730 [uncultured Chloroflexia bacterium]